MNDFKKNNNFRGKEMFRAICASCNKSCEVPFKPNGKKPVYCKDCYAANGGQVAEPRDSRPVYSQPARRDFQPAQSYKPEYRAEKKPENNGGTELKRTLELMNAKLDKLVQILSEKAVNEKVLSIPTKEAKGTIKAPKKLVIKKPVSKKKK